MFISDPLYLLTYILNKERGRERQRERGEGGERMRERERGRERWKRERSWIESLELYFKTGEKVRG